MKQLFNARATIAALTSFALWAANVPAGAQAQTSVSANWVLTTTQGPSGRGGPSLAYDALHQKTVLFGGSSSYLGDTWEYDGTGWTQLPVQGPTARYLAPMVYDSSRNVAVLFGGYNFNGILGDTWEWNGTAWTQRLPQHVPTPRLWTAMSYDAARQVAVLFGGATGTGLLNDTWEYGGTDWVPVTTAHSPPVRRGHALAYDSARGRTVLFGGQDPSGVNLNDTWEFDGSDWTQVFPAHTPSARLWHSMAYDSNLGGTVLFGGAADSNNALNDTWLYDGTDWQQIPPTGMNGKLQAAMSYDPNRNELILFGGAANIQYYTQYAETLALRGVTTSTPDWAQANPASSPSPRVYAAMDYDSARGVSVLFSGGNGGSGGFQDTWEWNGTNWNLRSPATSPPAVSGAAMAYDSTRHVSVLFGGSTSAGPSSSTWEWDGTNWVQKSPATAPTARVWASMAYDSTRGQVVLFGGGSNLNDTWLYNGTTWTQALPATAPSPRFGAAMTYDSVRGRVVLFGGWESGTRLADTWEWDGTNWTQIVTVTAPYPRFWSSMTFDAQRGKTILFGGDHIQPFALGEQNDTWEWDGTTWVRDWTAAAPPARAGQAMAYDSGRGRVVIFGGWNPATSPITIYGDTWELGSGIQTPAGSPNATLDVGGQGTTFGSVNVGSSSPHQAALFVSSTGTGPLTINSITSTGDFVVSSTDCPSNANVFASGSYCVTLVSFTPTAAGPRSGTVTISDNAPNGGFVVQFQGTGVLTQTAITVTPVVALFSTSATFTATLVANGSPLAGQPVTFQLPTGSTTTVSTNSQGIAVWAGASLSGIHVGSYPSGVQVSFAGTSGYAPSSASGALTVTQPVFTTYAGDFFVGNTSGARLAVTIDQRTPASDRQFLDYSTTPAWVRFNVVGPATSSDFYAQVNDAPDWTTSGLGIASVNVPVLPDGAYTITATLVSASGSTTLTASIAGDDVRVGLVSSPTKAGFLSGGGAIASDPLANTSDTHGYFSLQMKPAGSPSGNLVYVYRARMDVGNGTMRDVDVWVTSTDVTSLDGTGSAATATGHFKVAYIDAQTGQRYSFLEFSGGTYNVSAANATNKAAAAFALVLRRPDGTIFHATGPVNPGGNAQFEPVVLGSLLSSL